MSYKKKDTQTLNLFKELMPFGGQLNEGNRWIKLSELIPWEKLDGIYRQYFSRLGRPGKDSRLINGLLIVKHMLTLSDEEVVKYFLENPYVQYFCGYDQFVRYDTIDSSTLSKMRKRLGVEYFREFETEILEILKVQKIIKNAKEQMIDATVFPANITYPTDAGLIERAREWVVRNIKNIIKETGANGKIRTYCRKAKQTYLKFQKKRRKTFKEIYVVNKRLLQYLRRNMEQLRKVIEAKSKEISVGLKIRIEERLEVVKRIYVQQLEMLKTKTHSIKDRIVSLHQPKIRPIVRGKKGKEVEFGVKAILSYVAGYLFLDKMEFDAFCESKHLKESIDMHETRFGELPEVVTTDNIFGTRENRKMLKELNIEGSLMPLGRKQKEKEGKKNIERIKKRQRGRSCLEGFIGNAKEHYGLERVLYKIVGGEEIWVRMGLMAMNLSTAMARK